MDVIVTFFKSLWGFLYSFKPSYISRKPKYTFIDLHGAWILGNALFASALLMIGTKIPYVDALFLASGAATQSGLNTIDLNSLTTFQQIVLYSIPMWTNPIIINTFIVLLRIFWFQRRMVAVVQAAKTSRRTIGRTFSRSRVRDLADEQGGLNGRRIVVMHETRPNTAASAASAPSTNDFETFPTIKEDVKDSKEEEGTASSSSSDSGPTGHASNTEHDTEIGHPLRPQITFADQPKPSHLVLDQARGKSPHLLSPRRDGRNPDEVLRIPSPRDAEKGIIPRALDDSDQLHRPLSRGVSAYSRSSAPEHNTLSPIPTAPRRGITIAATPRHSSDASSTVPSVENNNNTTQSWFRKPSWPKWGRHDTDDDANGSELRPIRSRISTFASYFKTSNGQAMPYLSWDPTIGRNSAFVDLTEDQREELGGIEYRSLKLLSKILAAYFLGFTLFGIIGVMPWIMHSQHYGRDVVNAAGTGRPWWAIYTSSSAFNDVGFTLTPDSMISFKSAKWPLVLFSYLIIIGNTGFPVMLRVTIWLFSKIVPQDTSVWEELQFLLDHPRRCFTLLFPAKETWTLFWILVGLNGLDLVLYVVLDLNTEAVLAVPVHIRVLNGWFQAVSTRTAGFSVVDLSALHPSVQISYLVMMYISIFPIAISVRRTNVYEEDSLGVYSDPNEEGDENQPSYVASHLRRQLSYDLWYIFLGFFIISIVEGQRLGDDSAPRFSMFALLFEIVSAYGTVGLSLGYPDVNQSFSVKLKTLSKLIIIAMEIRGRHRGLPYALDRAILLPSEKRLLEEEAAAAARMQRRMSMNSATGSAVGNPMTRSRTRSSERGRSGGISIIGSFLGPGPAMPIHRRTQQKEETIYVPRPNTRRHSVGTTGQRGRRNSVDPDGLRHQFFSGLFGGTNNATSEAAPATKPEGRRSFFQEGVNPAPPTPSGPAATKAEGKQA